MTTQEVGVGRTPEVSWSQSSGLETSLGEKVAVNTVSLKWTEVVWLELEQMYREVGWVEVGMVGPSKACMWPSAARCGHHTEGTGLPAGRTVQREDGWGSADSRLVETGVSGQTLCMLGPASGQTL